VYKLCIRANSCNVDKFLKIVYYAFMSQTYQPKKKKRAVTHGFLVRSKTTNGKNILARRRQKGRVKLTVSQDK
jgi:large subunit ribosomal protein L34